MYLFSIDFKETISRSLLPTQNSTEVNHPVIAKTGRLFPSSALCWSAARSPASFERFWVILSTEVCVFCPDLQGQSKRQ